MIDIYKDMMNDIMDDVDFSDIGFELSEDELEQLDNIELNDTNRIANPEKEINIVEITQSANGKLYKFYILPVSDYINQEFAVYIKHKDSNTKGYLFPTFDNVYNNRYLDEVVSKGNFRTITTNTFTDDMYESISDDLEYKLFAKFLQLFTLKKGVVIHGI